MLVNTARLNSRDLALLVKVLEVLCHVTVDFDPTLGVASTPTEDFTMGDSEVDIDSRERILADLLHNHVDLLTDVITGDINDDLNNNANGTANPGGASLSTSAFWARYNAVKLLQRLQDFDGLSLPKILVDGHSLHSLIALLNDTSNDGMLRNEGMLLLNSLTMSDKELQKILAFSDCFETLFAVIGEEGGVDGGIIVIDALSIIRNLLRSNDPTQKYFKEMGFADKLIPLIRDTSPSAGAEGLPLTDRGRDVVMFAVDVVSCLLVHSGSKQSGPSGLTDEHAHTQEKLSKSGILQPLARVGLSQSLDEKTSLAALRVTLELIKGSKTACEALLAAETQVLEAKKVPAIWTLLYTTLYHKSTSRQQSCLRILEALLSTPSVSARVASVVVKGLAPTQQGGGGLSCGFLLGTCLMAQQQQQGSNGGSPASASGFSSHPAPNAMHHAAFILNLLLQLPLVTTQLLHIPWSNNVTFFVAYIAHVVRVMKHREADLGSTTRLFMPLFSWLEHCSASTSMFLSDPANFAAFEKWASNKKAPVSIRLLCTLVCLRVCLAAQTLDLPPTVRVGKAELAQAFLLGQNSVNNLMFSVTADPDWKDAPESCTSESSQHDGIVTWDNTMKDAVTGLLHEIEENKGRIEQTGVAGGGGGNGIALVEGDQPDLPQLEHHTPRQLHELLRGDTHNGGDSSKESLVGLVEQLRAALRDSIASIRAEQHEHAAVREQLDLVVEDYGKTMQRNEELEGEVARLAASEPSPPSALAAGSASSTEIKETPRLISHSTAAQTHIVPTVDSGAGSADDAWGRPDETHLQRQLEDVVSERDELYILVADLDDELMRIKGGHHPSGM